MRPVPKALVIAACLCAPAPAFAIGTCPSPVFFCKMEKSGKAVSVCETGSQLTYEYGPLAGEAELVLSVDRSSAIVTPWNGMGSTYWSTLEIPNGDWSYMLSVSYDRENSDDKGQGSLTVLRDGTERKRFGCIPETVAERIESLAN